LIGIGAGWWLKPSNGGDGSPGEDGARAAMHEERPAVADGSGDSDGVAEKTMSGPRVPREKKGGLLSPGAHEGAKRMLASMEERRAKRTEARIAELVAKLGLSSQQEARLRAHFDAQKPEVTVDAAGNSVRVDSRQAMSPQERAASLDKLMEEMLTEDQQEAYETFKETERNQQVEARALRDMASLTQAVELRDDQRDAVYEILQNNARSEAGTAMEAGMPPVGMLANAEFTAGPDGEGAVVRMVAPGVEGANQEEVMNQMREQQQARVDAKVESLSGVLDAAQLAAYRAQLEQGAVMIGP
jgi:hypothetical protein